MTTRDSTRQELRDLAKLAATMPKERPTPLPPPTLQRPPTPSAISTVTVPPAVASIPPASMTLPPFEAFWEAGIAEAHSTQSEPVMLAGFRADPEKNRLKTPSGKIEIFSEKIHSFGYDDCPGHVVWLEPIEWLGSKTAERYPLHMLSDQPADKLPSHSIGSSHTTWPGQSS